MKDSGIEWIGEIPEGWSVSKVLHCLSMPITDGPHTTPILYDTGIPFVSAEAVSCGNGRIDFSHIRGYISEKFYKECCQKYIPEIDDIYMIKSGATTGRVAIVDTTRVFTIWSPLAVFRCNKDCMLPKFLFYYLQSPAFQKEVEFGWTFGTQQNVGMRSLEQMKVCVPPLNEQNTIVHHLDYQCAQIDLLLQKARSSIEEYKNLKQAVITQAVTKGVRGEREMKDSGIEWIGTYPSNWKIIKIKWLLHERKDRSVTGLEEPLSMSQKKGLIPTKEMDSIPNMASSFIGAKLVYKGDLVFNKLKAHLGVFSVSKYNGLVSPDYAVYYSTGLANLNFLELLFKTPQYINEFKKKSSGVGAGLTRLYTDDLYSIYCALPPLVEQEEIADYLDIKCTEIDGLIAKKEQLVKELESYKKSLIYEVVTGKREV